MEAQKKFLGKGSVIGVGIMCDSDEKLVFFLGEHSEDLERQISDWASDRGVPFVLQVTGPLQIR
jgi:hypothetical protein